MENKKNESILKEITFPSVKCILQEGLFCLVTSVLIGSVLQIYSNGLTRLIGYLLSVLS